MCYGKSSMNQEISMCYIKEPDKPNIPTTIGAVCSDPGFQRR